MSIEHRLIPDNQLHEPKGAASALIKTVYHSNGSGSGTWRKTTEADIDYSNKVNNQFGWIDIADSQYIAGSPLSISSGVRTNLPNNAGSSQTNLDRLGPVYFSGTSKFHFNDLNASYLLRIQIQIKAAAAAGTPYTAKIELESANGPIVLASNEASIKGGGHANSVSTTMLFYLGSAVNDTDIKVYVTPDTNITLYDIGYVVQRLYKEV